MKQTNYITDVCNVSTTVCLYRNCSHGLFHCIREEKTANWHG